MADEPHFDTTLPPASSRGGEFVSPGGESVPFDLPVESGDLGRFGQYRIVRLLGEGGMGLVFEGFDPALGRPVAIKMLKPTLARQPKFHERFLREARVAVAASLQKGEHGVMIHAVAELNGVPHIVMELLRGESLDDRLRRERPLPPAEVIRVGRAVAEGLAAAHAAGVLHRDIKPSNVWLEAGSGRVKILDYGLGREIRGDALLTSTGALLGTPAFMSPEQARGEALDERSDLFSLGAMLYVLATGRLPFPGESTMAILTALATQAPPPPHEVNAAVPLGLSHLIMRLLAKDPANRPAADSEVAAALRSLEQGSNAAPTELLTPPPSPARPPVRKRRWTVRLLVAAALALVVLPLGCCAAVILIPAIQKTIGGGAVRTTKLMSASQSESKVQIRPQPTDLDMLGRKIATMQPSDQLKAVEAELGARNQSGITVTWSNHDQKQVTGVHLLLAPNNDFDIAPLRILSGLKTLRIEGQRPDPRPIVIVTITNFGELWPLRLEEFHCSYVRLMHLAPLKGMPLTNVRCDGCDIQTLEPLRGMKLKSLNVSSNRVADLSPLEKMPLERLDVSDTRVENLVPLKGMPLIELKCALTLVKSLEALDGNPTLAVLTCPPLSEKDQAIVRRLPALKLFNGGPVP